MAKRGPKPGRRYGQTEERPRLVRVSPEEIPAEMQRQMLDLGRRRTRGLLARVDMPLEDMVANAYFQGVHDVGETLAVREHALGGPSTISIYEWAQSGLRWLSTDHLKERK